VRLDRVEFRVLGRKAVPADIRSPKAFLARKGWPSLGNRAVGRLDDLFGGLRALPWRVTFGRSGLPDGFGEVLGGRPTWTRRLGSGPAGQGQGCLIFPSNRPLLVATSALLPPGPVVATVRFAPRDPSGRALLTFARTMSGERPAVRMWQAPVEDKKENKKILHEFRRYWLGRYGFAYVDGRLSYAELRDSSPARRLALMTRNVAVASIEVRGLAPDEVPAELRDPVGFLRTRSIVLSRTRPAGSVFDAFRRTTGRPVR